MNRHLGDLAAAFVDRQLDARTRARVLRHLDDCPRCAAEVAAQREVKLWLGRLQQPVVPDVLTARLLDRSPALPAPAGPPPARPAPAGGRPGKPPAGPPG